MVQLSEKAIESFQKVYREECGDELSADEANEIANRFLTMVKNIYQPIRRDNEKTSQV